LARNQDNVSECGDMSIRELLCHRASMYKNPAKNIGPHHHFIEN